jgi:iron complex outermembrane receptor protein
VLVDGNLISSPLSAGGETLYGIAAELSTHSYHGFSLYLSGQYLRSRFDDNIAIGSDFLPTKGKDMVVSPRWSGSAGLRYENGPFFAQLTGKYTGKQYSTFMNDQSMPSSTIFDLSLGYRLPDIGALKSPSIRVNMTNLGNDAYIASVAGFTPNALPTRGINGTTIAGANPIYYVGAPLTVMATLRTDF